MYIQSVVTVECYNSETTPYHCNVTKFMLFMYILNTFVIGIFDPRHTLVAAVHIWCIL